MTYDGLRRVIGRKTLKSPCLLDHLVGAGKQRWRHGEAERPRCLDVDSQLEPRRKLNRKFARLRASKANAAHVSLNIVFMELPDGHGRCFSGNYLSSVNPTRKVT
jgi:hypothetical protein